MTRAIILVMDSFGIGATRDAEKFGSTGANTLGHIAEQCALGQANFGRKGSLNLPNLTRLGLMHAARDSSGEFPAGTGTDVAVTGAYGYAEELSSGKDTCSGHWEITGVPVLSDWGYFLQETHSFPQEFLRAFIEKTGLPGVLGNCHASGTEIIAQLGEKHMRTGRPIVYTSADSVFQVACHEESFGLDRLLDICRVAYEMLADYKICRVIARPFVGGSKAEFKRTGNRRDFSVPPPSETLLDKIISSGGEVLAVGKISDIFSGRGISEKIAATGLEELFNATINSIKKCGERGLVFTNFVDFDSEFGHRRDLPGYARALEYFDQKLPDVLSVLQKDDVLIITADHGCDPTWPGSDHTREHIPVLVYGQYVTAGPLGLRHTFADIGQSLASHLGLPATDYGTSFLQEA